MMNRTCVLCVALFSLGTGACDQTVHDTPNDATTINETVDKTADSAVSQQAASPADDGQRDREDVLPSTASPLILAGLLGLLSLGGAVVVRFLGRL